MSQARRCDQCGEPYIAKRPNSRFCGGSCRMAAARDRRATGRAGGAAGVVEKPMHPSPVDAVRAALERAGRLETPVGILAVSLADRLGHASDSAAPGLARELRATLAEALEGARGVGDALDQLRDRRDAKRDRAAAG